MQCIRKVSPLSVAVLFLLASCGDGPSGPNPEVKKGAAILSFEASEDRVWTGDEVTLRWTTKDAVVVRLMAGEEAIRIDGGSPDEGSVEVVVRETTTFRLIAVGANGSAVTGEQKVEARVPEPPAIQSFTASPERVGPGGEAILSWSAAGADVVMLFDPDGGQAEVALEGSRPVVPLASGAYTLVAQGRGGTARATVSVTLVPEPQARLRATPRELVAGETTVLSWQSSDAADVRLVARRGDDAPVTLSTMPSGELPVEPSRTTTYVLEANGDGGQRIETETVVVRPAILAFTVEESGTFRPGAEVELAWSLAGATTARLSNGIDWEHELVGDELVAGTIRGRVGLGGSFRLDAAAPGAEPVSRIVFVDLTEEPRIVKATLSPAQGVTAGRGIRGTVELSWEVEGAVSPLELEQLPGGPVDLGGKSSRKDRVELEVAEPTTFRLTARNASGRHQLLLQAPVHMPPVIRSFEALPARLAIGERVELRWTTEDAHTVSLERGGQVLATGPLSVSGSWSEVVLANSVFVLRAYNALGFEVASTPITVDVGAPVIHSFVSSPGVVQPGGAVEFHWKNEGGNSLRVVGSGGAQVCSTPLPTAIREGHCTMTAPTTLGTATYRLEVTNGAGTTQKSLAVEVTDAPTIAAFSASPALLTAGEPVLLAWKTKPGLLGELPTLRIEDDRGNTYDVSDLDPLEGERSFVLPSAGSYTFTLSAISGDPATAPRWTASARAVEAASVVAVASPPFAQQDNEDVSLGWTSVNAISLEVFQLTRNGAQVGEPLCTASTEEEAGSGSCVVRPTIVAPHYRILAKNALGSVTALDVRVGVNPATVASFVADPPELLVGESTTLRWNIERADRRELGPRYRETSHAFVDLSGRAEGMPAPPSEGWINVPNGFAFPFFGRVLNRFYHCEGQLAVVDPGQCGSLGFYMWEFPTADMDINFLPFLGPATPNSTVPGSGIWSGLIEDPATGKRAFVVQWNRFRLSSSATSNLNFEVLYFEDGTFEFRYGAMSNPSNQSWADGEVAWIGYQSTPSLRSPNIGLALGQNTAVPGGLSNRSFTFFPDGLEWAQPVEPVGEKTVTPARSVELGLLATNAHSDHLRKLRIMVHPRATLTAAASKVGEGFRLGWNGTNLTRLTVEDPAGATIFTSSSVALANSGLVDVSSLPPGSHSFVLRGVGRLPHDTIERTVTVEVEGALFAGRFAMAMSMAAPSGPSLEAIELDAPTIVAPDSLFSVTWRIRNAGDLAASDVPFAILLSRDEMIGLGDRILATGIATIEAEGEEGGVLELRLPADVPEGSYHLGLVLDPQGSFAAEEKPIPVAVSAPVLVAASELRILTEDFPPAEVGSDWCVRLDAVGGASTYLWSVPAGSILPPGLGLRGLPEGEAPLLTWLCGRPKASGVFSFALEVSSGGATASRSYELRVSKPSLPLSLATTELQQVAFLAPFEILLRAIDGTPPYRWSIASGRLPDGVELRLDGALRGAPEEDGRFPFSIEVSDAAGRSVGGDLVLQVAAPGELSCGTSMLPGGTLGVELSATLRAAGGVRPYRWESKEVRRLSTGVGDPAEILGSGPPPGLGLNASGEVGGTPTQTGRFLWELEVTDAGRVPARATCTIRFEVPEASSLVVATTELLPAVAGRSYRASLAVSGAVGEVRWKLVGSRLPDGLELLADGTIEGAPMVAQLEHRAALDFPFLVEVRDSQNRRGIAPLSIRLLAEAPSPNPPPVKDENGGGCSSGGGAPSALALFASALLGFLRRRVTSLAEPAQPTSPPASDDRSDR